MDLAVRYPVAPVMMFGGGWGEFDINTAGVIFDGAVGEPLGKAKRG